MQKSKRQLAAHRGPAWAVWEGEFDPLWSRPPAPTLEAEVSVTRLPQVTCLVTTLEAAVSVTHLPQVTCLVTCVGHQAKAPQLFSLTQPPCVWLLGGLSCSRCHLSSLTPVRAKCRPLGLSRSPLTPRGCTPIDSALLASACTEVFSPGSPGPPTPVPVTLAQRPGAGPCSASVIREGGLGGGEKAGSFSSCSPVSVLGLPPQTPLLSRSRASGSRWSRPGSRRSCTRPRSPPRRRTPWKRPSRRPWRWPAGCTR